MKPILFPADATTFTSNGLGALDPTRCVVTEARNGEYELECQLSVDSVHYGDIANNMILAVKPGDGGSLHAQADIQAFRIYEITEPLNGVVTLSARHISYDLSYNTVMPCTAASITAAFDAILANVVETCPFTFQTDKSTAANFKVTTPQTVRGVLGGQQGSILDVYGGEYQWNNYIVQLWNHRGTDANATLRYGKNITDINQEQNLENVVTGIVPFWASEDTVVTLPEKSVDSTYASSYPFKRTVPVDFSSTWENAPTESQLRSKAQSYITANNIGVPKVSIKVSFVALWQTEEYKDIAPLERVHLCDTVGVVFEKYGINTRAEVIKTEWDCLAERYLSIELGEARSSMASTLVKMDADQTQALEDTKTNLERAIEVATDWLTNADSHVYIVEDENTGSISEFLFVNGNQPIQTATQVMRLNAAGLGFSKNGVNGPFTNAFVFDSDKGGHLVADFITAGTMLADRILGGTLKLGGNNNGNGVLEIYNTSGTKIMTIDSTGIYYANNTFKVAADGKLSATGASIGGVLTSETGLFKTVVEDGKVKFYYNNTLISQLTGAHSGIASYISFAGANGSDTTVDVTGEISADNGNFDTLYAADEVSFSGSENHIGTDDYTGTNYIGDKGATIIGNNAATGGTVEIKGALTLSPQGAITIGSETAKTGYFYDRDGNRIEVTNGHVTYGLQ